jgi:hypothetical protein
MMDHSITGDEGALCAPVDDLGAVVASAFRLFARGVADRRSAFRTPTVATVGADGAPRVRTMVLRGFDAAARRLTLHTDRRAAKLADIGHEPRVAVHVYDARAAIQVRLAATARLHAGDEVARAAWARGLASSRACYAIDPGPGTEVALPPPAARFSEAGFDHFAVLAVSFDALEWLWLHHGGHRRARFAWAADGSCAASWVVP